MELFVEFKASQCYTGIADDANENYKKEERKSVLILSGLPVCANMHRMEEKIWKQRK